MTELTEDRFIDIREELAKFHGKKVTVEIKSSEEDERKIIKNNEHELHVKGKIKINTSIKEFKNSDVVNVCKKYVEWLGKIVEECKQKFN